MKCQNDIMLISLIMQCTNMFILIGCEQHNAIQIPVQKCYITLQKVKIECKKLNHAVFDNLTMGGKNYKKLKFFPCIFV